MASLTASAPTTSRRTAVPPVAKLFARSLLSQNIPPPTPPNLLQEVRVLSLNAASIVKRGACDSLSAYCLDKHIDIVALCETWASENISSAELSCDGRFSVFRKDRSGRRGGGVCLLIAKNLLGVEVPVDSLPSEVVAVDILIDTPHQHRIVCAYASPTGSSHEVIERIRLLCTSPESLCHSSSPTLVVGDLNLPLINWKYGIVPGSSDSKEFIFYSFCISHGFAQLVESATPPAS